MKGLPGGGVGVALAGPSMAVVALAFFWVELRDMLAQLWAAWPMVLMLAAIPLLIMMPTLVGKLRAWWRGRSGAGLRG